MEYFIQFVIENWYIEIPLIISIAALILFEKSKRASKIEPQAATIMINKQKARVLDVRKKWGDEQVHIWRRSYDTPPPGGESLKNTAERVLPYFENIIYPELRNQKDILISAHGNSLRALIMYLEKISEDEIVKLEIATGQPIVYKLDEDLQVISKEIL